MKTLSDYNLTFTMMMKLKQSGYWLLLILLTGCAWQPITEPRRFDPANEPTPLPLREAGEKPTFTVERGTVAQQFTLRGRIGSAVEVPIETDKEGIVSSVVVGVGAAVVEGDLLALLDTSAIEAELMTLETAQRGIEAQLELLRDQQSAEINAASLNLERATLQLSNAQANGAAESELRILEIDVELAQLALDQIDTNLAPDLQNELRALQQRIAILEAQKETMRLFSPSDGDLVGLNLELGRRVRSGSIIGTLTNLDQRVIWAEANNSNIAQMEEGMSVTLAFPDTPEETFGGVIVTLPFPHGTGGVRRESVQIVADDLLPDSADFGSRVNITVVSAEKPDVLWLPPAAIRDFAGQTFVIVQDGDSERRADVTTGITSVGRIEIVEGLQEGETILAP